MLPRINLRRTYLIARRDFLGYIKTWGFWLSFLMPFIIFPLAILIPRMNINVDPVRYETILDETGLHADALKAFDKRSPSSPTEMPTLEDIEGARTIFVEPPADTIEAAKPYLTGGKTLLVDGEPQSLTALLHIYELDGSVQADFWSPNITNERLKNVANRYFRHKAIDDYMISANTQLQDMITANTQLQDAIDKALKSNDAPEKGERDALEKGERPVISTQGLDQAEASAPRVKAYDPSKKAEDGGQAVTINDQIPIMVSVAATMLLWLTIFSGAYMLLTSMLEEKLNKLLEMMLATTRLSEIMVGKLLGVAALTLTAMMPYIVLTIGGSVFLSFMFDPQVATAILGAITPKLLIFFFVFLILGYVFYGALFIAVGSLAESMQDAQTITTPIILILTACVMVVPLSWRSPDSPLLVFASWFPLSAPFGAIARLPQDPPWWELALSAFFLFLLSIVVIWLAGRILRYGVLSGSGVKGAMDWVKRVIFRRKVT